MKRKVTLQSIFNDAWEAFIVKKKLPCVDRHGTCYYTRGTNHCAVGWGLPVELREKIGKSNATFAQVVREHSEYFSEEVLKCDRLGFFQSALHDARIDFSSRHFEPNLENEYRLVAQMFGLTVPGEK